MKLIYAIQTLIINNLKFLIYKLLYLSKFKYNFVSFIHPSTSVDIREKGRIYIGRKCKIRRNCILSAKGNGVLTIGNNVFLNSNCQITSRKSISIGDGSLIGPNVVIVDHDHLYDSNKNYANKFKEEKVIVGKNVWIGANCTILKGVEIGDNSIIAAGTVVNHDVSNDSILYQSKENIVRKK